MLLASDRFYITDKNSTFASKNNGVNKYWANPNKNMLHINWYLILNDTEKHKLYLFYIPSNSFKSIPAFCKTNGLNEILLRGDKDELLDMQINYNDVSFTDTRSKIKFVKYLIGSINY